MIKLRGLQNGFQIVVVGYGDGLGDVSIFIKLCKIGSAE